MNKKPDLINELLIDFASASNNYRRLHGGGNGQPIAKAVGIKTYGLPLNIIDATAGLGQDAFVLASLGCNVTMLERSPEMAGLLTHALQNGALHTEIAAIISKMRLIVGDAYLILSELTAAQYPDVVYLDPMFPERNKTALVKKEMRILKNLVGDDLDADKLLSISRRIAKRRVVVKRPRTAPFLDNLQPHASQTGKANRFDIYMPS